MSRSICVETTFFFRKLTDILFVCIISQGGSNALPAADDNAIREYLCIKAYLVSSRRMQPGDHYTAYNKGKNELWSL